MEFDPYSTEFFEDPWDVYRWLRDEAPIYHHERLGFYAVSRYEDCVEVHRDVASYTSTRGVSLDQLRSDSYSEMVGEGAGSIIMLDPPMHDRLRKLVNRAFTPRRIAEWEPVVERVIHGFLDQLDGAEAFDVVVDFSGPVPVEVICEILGVPAGDRQRIRHCTDLMLEREVGNQEQRVDHSGGATLVGQPPAEQIDQPLHRMTPVPVRSTPLPKKSVRKGMG